MRKTAAALALALLAAAPGLFAAQAKAPNKTWMDQVRDYVVRNANGLGRQYDALMTAMGQGAADLKNDTSRGMASLTREGRRSMESITRGASRLAARATRATHDTFADTIRTIVPVGTQVEARPPVISTGEITSPILAPHFLRGHDILLAWRLNTGDHPIVRSAVLDDRLLLETDAHDIYSFAPSSGVLQWLFALPGPSQSAYAYDPNNVLVISNDILFELDRVIGRARRRLVLRFPASNPPTVEGDNVIIASWERRIYAINRETRVTEWAYVPDENVVGAVVTAPNMLYAGDLGGNLAAYSPADRREKWTYKTLDAIRVSLVMAGDDIVFPSEDLSVYCINRFGGLRHWKVPVQGFVTQPVWVEPDAVYFSADGDAFYAVNRKTGEFLWRVPRGGWPVAVGDQNIYIEGPDKEIWCIARKTGEKLWAVSAKPFTYLVRNTTNDLIYLCGERGEVYAFYLRGDHIEKKAPPEKPKPEAPGLEEPGALGAAPGVAPAVRRPAPKAAPAVKKPAPKAEEPKAEPEEKAEEKKEQKGAEKKGPETIEDLMKEDDKKAEE